MGVDHAHQLAVDVVAVGAFLEAGLEEARLLEVLPEVHVPVPAGVFCAVDGAGRNCERSWFLSWGRLLAGHPEHQGPVDALALKVRAVCVVLADRPSSLGSVDQGQHEAVSTAGRAVGSDVVGLLLTSLDD